MIVLDTHALIWWVGGDKQLSKTANAAIRRHLRAEDAILVSAITAWEIAMLVSKRRLVLAMDVADWLDTVCSIEGIRFVAVDPQLAVQSVRLPGEFHADPADRLITALARQYSVPLVTADARIHAYEHVKTVW